MKRTKIYWIWSAMIQRCTNPNNKQFNDYGARGITVCDSWLSFNAFYNDMGYLGPDYHLDRIDNSKGYSLDNCRWTSRVVNNKNKRVYKCNNTGISGVLPRNEGWRVRLRHLGNMVIDKTIDDFFEACCIRKAAENVYVVPYLTGEVK